MANIGDIFAAILQGAGAGLQTGVQTFGQAQGQQFSQQRATEQDTLAQSNFERQLGLRSDAAIQAQANADRAFGLQQDKFSAEQFQRVFPKFEQPKPLTESQALAEFLQGRPDLLEAILMKKGQFKPTAPAKPTVDPSDVSRRGVISAGIKQRQAATTKAEASQSVFNVGESGIQLPIPRVTPEFIDSLRIQAEQAFPLQQLLGSQQTGQQDNTDVFNQLMQILNELEGGN